tara:strand:- start:56073 stop:57266 length:1194 start_codon:yes stop_codon:yes gene_type:complete
MLITDSYPPEIRSAAQLMKELAEELVERGHVVTVLTTWPQYNIAKNQNLDLIKPFSVENGVKVRRIKTLRHHNVNYIFRGISQILMPFYFKKEIRKHSIPIPDVVVIYSPPLTLSKVGIFLKKKYGAKLILNVQDLFPQNAIDLGVLKNELLVKYFEKMENNAYFFSDSIAVHSEGNRRYLIDQKKVSKDKVDILHNWIDTSAFVDQEKYDFRKEFSLENKFVFLFAGVIGPSQYLDLIIDIANDVQDKKDIRFLFVGDGAEKNRLIEKSSNLENILFKPFVSSDLYPALVSSVDVGLVCLSPANKTPVVPGKILGYMAGALPVIAFLHEESDGHKVIKESKSGISVLSGNYEKALEALLEIYNRKDLLSSYGQNGLEYVNKNFEKKICVSNLERLF